MAARRGVHLHRSTAPGQHSRLRVVPGGRAGLQRVSPVPLQPPDIEESLPARLSSLLGALTAGGQPRLLRAQVIDVLAAWAAELATLHHRPLTAAAPQPPRPAVLSDDPVPGELDRLVPVAGWVRVVRTHPGVLGALAQARESWAPTAWVHGEDAGAVLVRHTGLHAPVRCELVDGAGTGRGDARWDVACALDWLAVAVEPALDPAWRLDPVLTFLTAYRALGGTSEPSRPLAVARTLATATRWSLAATADRDDLDPVWLASLWARPLRLVGDDRQP